MQTSTRDPNDVLKDKKKRMRVDDVLTWQMQLFGAVRGGLRELPKNSVMTENGRREKGNWWSRGRLQRNQL
jgi:hypothetical protein